jgi:hypothetical protein
MGLGAAGAGDDPQLDRRRRFVESDHGRPVGVLRPVISTRTPPCDGSAAIQARRCPAAATAASRFRRAAEIPWRANAARGVECGQLADCTSGPAKPIVAEGNGWLAVSASQMGRLRTSAAGKDFAAAMHHVPAAASSLTLVFQIAWSTSPNRFQPSERSLVLDGRSCSLPWLWDRGSSLR